MFAQNSKDFIREISKDEFETILKGFPSKGLSYADARKPPVTNRGVKCATIEGKPNVKRSLPIVLDYCLASLELPIGAAKDEKGEPVFTVPIDQYKPDGGLLFQFELQKYPTEKFKRLYKITTCYAGEWVPFASMEIEPHADFIPDETCIFKVENKWCYASELLKVFNLFLSSTKMKFKYWKRLDVALDFTGFDWENCSPEDFIHAYQSERITMKGRKINRVRKNGETMDDHRHYIETKKGGKKYSGITWGSYASGVRVNMYNKTLEQKQKVVKPWIHDTWKVNALDTAKDVWRLEFQVKKDAFAVCQADTETGECSTIDFFELNMIKPQNFAALFGAQYKKHFVFALNQPEKKQFCRMQKIELLEADFSAVELLNVSEKTKSSNMEKYFIKRLVGVMNQHKNNPDKEFENWVLFNIVQDMVIEYGLEKWFQCAFPEIDIKTGHYAEKSDLGFYTEMAKQKELYKSLSKFVTNEN